MKQTARYHSGHQLLTPEGIKRISRWNDPEFYQWQENLKRSRRLFCILAAVLLIECVAITACVQHIRIKPVPTGVTIEPGSRIAGK